MLSNDKKVYFLKKNGSQCGQFSKNHA
jgi:hypothetical protein